MCCDANTESLSPRAEIVNLFKVRDTMSIEDVISDFEFLDEWEDKYRYVIELGRDMERLAPEEKTDAVRVRGCASQVWLIPDEIASSDGGPIRLTFRGESDAMIVQGLIAILLKIYNEKTPAEVLQADALATFGQLGLSEHLTPQRSNGLKSMIERIRHEAASRNS